MPCAMIARAVPGSLAWVAFADVHCIKRQWPKLVVLVDVALFPTQQLASCPDSMVIVPKIMTADRYPLPAPHDLEHAPPWIVGFHS